MFVFRLGRTGLIVSRFGFGSWVTFQNQVGQDSAYELMKTAYEGGVNFFDTAESAHFPLVLFYLLQLSVCFATAYAAGAAESIMGEAIQTGITQGVWKREDLVVATKIFFGTKPGHNSRGLSRKHLVLLFVCLLACPLHSLSRLSSPALTLRPLSLTP